MSVGIPGTGISYRATASNAAAPATSPPPLTHTPPPIPKTLNPSHFITVDDGEDESVVGDIASSPAQTSYRLACLTAPAVITQIRT